MKQCKGILKELLKISSTVFPEHYEQIKEKSIMLYTEFCEQEKGKPREIVMHTVKQIYPCIAFYKAATECTGDSEKAYSVVEQCFAERSEKTAKLLQKLCRMPFVVKSIPRLMAVIIHRVFGTKSGFAMIDRNLKKNICHIDMICCPYNSICSACGCPELTTAFCNSDDIAYGNMHPKLSWERRKTLGRGNDCCDFIMKSV